MLLSGQRISTLSIFRNRPAGRSSSSSAVEGGKTDSVRRAGRRAATSEPAALGARVRTWPRRLVPLRRVARERGHPRRGDPRASSSIARMYGCAVRGGRRMGSSSTRARPRPKVAGRPTPGTREGLRPPACRRGAKGHLDLPPRHFPRRQRADTSSCGSGIIMRCRRGRWEARHGVLTVSEADLPVSLELGENPDSPIEREDHLHQRECVALRQSPELGCVLFDTHQMDQLIGGARGER